MSFFPDRPSYCLSNHLRRQRHSHMWEVLCHVSCRLSIVHRRRHHWHLSRLLVHPVCFVSSFLRRCYHNHLSTIRILPVHHLCSIRRTADQREMSFFPDRPSYCLSNHLHRLHLHRCDHSQIRICRAHFSSLLTARLCMCYHRCRYALHFCLSQIGVRKLELSSCVPWITRDRTFPLFPKLLHIT